MNFWSLFGWRGYLIMGISLACGAAWPAHVFADTSIEPPAATDARSEGRAHCKVEKPAAWTSGHVSWFGGCRAEFADGYGVIVSKAEGGEVERFFGRVNRGYLGIGVLQSNSGFTAGNWTHGVLAEPLADDVAQRNALIAAFDVAASAATSVSKWFSKKANAKSSRFYAKQARLLRAQMD